MVSGSTATTATGRLGHVQRTTEVSRRQGVRPPTWHDVKFLFVGAGNMGARLALNYAQQGFPVGILDITEERLAVGTGLIETGQKQAVGRRIYTPGQAGEIRSRILTTTDYEQACRGRNLQLVVETATERLDIKQQILEQLDQLCASHVIFTSNSSSLPIDRIAGFTGRPDRVAWTHFFHEAHINRAGEYAGNSQTSRETLDRVREFLWLGGKRPFLIQATRKGGAADPIFVALLKEATAMLEEGYSMATIEAAAKNALGMPMGFFELMDVTGIPVGVYSMKSFSDSSDPADPFFKVYGNFYAPTSAYVELAERYELAPDAEKQNVRWFTDEKRAEAADQMQAQELAQRFLGVTFIVSTEVVAAGLIKTDELRELIKTAFLWREDPFEIMNQYGINVSREIARSRAKLAVEQGVPLAVPWNLENQASFYGPWKLQSNPVVYADRGDGVVEIDLMRPGQANAMDNSVFQGFQRAFGIAQADGARVILFDTAPIKTFIAGADIQGFLRAMRAGSYMDNRNDTEHWQGVLFEVMTGTRIPKVVIADGQALGGGVEVLQAFAHDPNSVVIATQRTTLTFPETRLGIYPGLRGTILPLHIIRAATGDDALALAVTRAMILARQSIVSPALLKFLGFADFVAPSHLRNEAADKVTQAILDNGGIIPDKGDMAKLGIEEVDLSLTDAEQDQLRLWKILFTGDDFLPKIYAYAMRMAQPPLSGLEAQAASRIAVSLHSNSPHAVAMAHKLINDAWRDLNAGVPIRETAHRELDQYLVPTFEHPDALEGLTALAARRFPVFER